MSAKWKEIFVSNFELLGFNNDNEVSKRKIVLHPSMFDKPNNAGFDVCIYHLLRLIDPAKCEHLLKTCYPPVDKKRVLEFRKHTCPWLRQIADMNPNHNIPKIKSTLMLSPCGNEVIQLLNSLSSFVLFKCLDKHEPGKAPLPLRYKERLSHAQYKFMNTLAIHDNNDLMHTMELVKKTDQEILKLSKELSTEFHSLQKRNKQGLKSVEQLNAVGFTSESKMIAAKQQEIKQLQGMWGKLDETHQRMSEKNDIVEQLVTRTSESALCLRGSDIELTVPSLLIESCQEEIYQNVGSTLYENGKVNLSSFLFLWNLSLKLLLEKLYSVELPNFEKPLHSIGTLMKVLEANKVKLFDISRELSKHYEKVKSDKDKYTSLLHNMYTQKESYNNDTLFHQTESFDQHKVQHSNFVGRFEEAFLLPDTDFLEETVGFKITAKPLTSVPASKNPNSFLIEADNKENVPKKIDSVAKTKKTQNNSRKNNKNSKTRLKQGILKPNRPEVNKPAALIIPPKEGVIVTGSENKLMDMIVDEVMDNNSPLGVYQQDAMSQLDESAFVSQDKLARSPIIKQPHLNEKQNKSLFFDESNLLSPLTTSESFLIENSDSTSEKFTKTTSDETNPTTNSHITPETTSNLNLHPYMNQSAGLEYLISTDKNCEISSSDLVELEDDLSPLQSLASSRPTTPNTSHSSVGDIMNGISQADDGSPKNSFTENHSDNKNATEITLVKSCSNETVNNSENNVQCQEKSFAVVDSVLIDFNSPESNEVPTYDARNIVENDITGNQFAQILTESSNLVSKSNDSSTSSSNNNSTHDSISPPLSTSISSHTSRSNSLVPDQPTKEDDINEEPFDFNIEINDKNWLDELDTSLQLAEDLIDFGEEPPLIDFGSRPTVPTFDLLVSSPGHDLQSPLL